MKWLLNPCRRQRESLCLLASGLLPEPDRVRIENHLAACADCRSYYNEIKTVTAPLAAWEKHFAHIEPGVSVQSRLTKATQSTGRPEFLHLFAPKIVLFECWQQLILPSRRIWAGLAAVWVLLLGANVSLHGGPQTAVAKSAPTSEMILSFRQQEKILAELIGPNELRATAAPKPFSPQPRSEQQFEATAV